MHSRRAAARRPSSHDGLCQLSRLLIDDVSAILPRATGGLQDAERYHGSAHVLPTPRCRGNMLAHAGPTAQEVSELVVTKLKEKYPEEFQNNVYERVVGPLFGEGRTRKRFIGRMVHTTSSCLRSRA